MILVGADLPNCPQRRVDHELCEEIMASTAQDARVVDEGQSDTPEYEVRQTGRSASTEENTGNRSLFVLRWC
jgi:hypothetical protein